MEAHCRKRVSARRLLKIVALVVAAWVLIGAIVTVALAFVAQQIITH